MSQNPSRLRAKRRVRLLAPVLLVTVAALVVWMVASVWASFSPNSEIILSSDQSGDNADVTSNFNIPAPNVNFDAVVTFTPPEWGIALDEDVPDGDTIGTLDAQATLGIAVGQQVCNTALGPSFTLYDCTTTGAAFTDTGDWIAGTWNGYDAACPGQGNGERQVCHYPGFLAEIFSKRPIARYCGHTVIIPGLESSLNFMVFEPGTNLGAGIPSNPDWGFPSVTVLNNTGSEAGVPAPSALADFCTPLVSNNTVNGLSSSGAVLRTNPEFGGTYVFRSWARGLPDADGDGFENGVDTCPYDDNLGDIRVQGPTGDADQDGLDDACDPNTATPAGDFDEDNDGYVNRADNCPVDPNGVSVGPNNQDDSDGDGIGDECDDSPGSIDGSRPVVVSEEPVDIEGPAAPTETPTATATATATGTATPTPVAGTALAAAVAAGANQITVTDASGLAVGDDITIGTGATTETCEITAISGSTLTLDCELEFAHAAGEPVVKAEEATPTPTAVAGEGCTPVIPGTYNGLVRLNGVPAASGFEVSASVGGTVWGTAIVSGGRYAIDIPDHLPTAPPCFEAGTIAFSIDGATCTPTAQWGSGLHDLDLTCAAAATPTPTVAPPTVPPATPPVVVTGTPTRTATATPAGAPRTGGGGLGGGQDVPLWAIMLAGWAGVTALAGLATLATRIAKR